MIKDPSCFEKVIRDVKPEFVIHTASPFFDEVGEKESNTSTKDNNTITKNYIQAGRLLVR